MDSYPDNKSNRIKVIRYSALKKKKAEEDSARSLNDG